MFDEDRHTLTSTDNDLHITPTQVRKLGALMDVPDAFLKRHPFPGPGLAVRP